MVHACASLGIPDMSMAELQSAPHDVLRVTQPIADQLRSISEFDVLAYVPRDASFAVSDVTALPLMDRFARSWVR